MVDYLADKDDALGLDFPIVTYTDPATYPARNPVRWDTKFGIIVLWNQILALTDKVYNDLPIDVRNETGATITKGSLVYISGWSAAQSRLLVSDADANSPITAPQFVVSADILTASNGTAFGSTTVTGLDTSSVTTVGDPVYLSGTAGEWTPTAPSAAGDMVYQVGTMTVKNATTGEVRFYPAEKILEKAGTSFLQAACVTLSKMAANSVDSDQYVDGSIDPVHLNNALADALPVITYAVGAEVGNSIDVTIQLKDAQGTNLAENHLLEIWLSDSATGIDTATAPSAGLSVTTGLQHEIIVASKRLKVETDSNGVAVIAVGEAGAATWYMRSQGRGQIYASSAITFP